MFIDVVKRFFIMLTVIASCLWRSSVPLPVDKSDRDVLLNAVIAADLHTDGDPTRDRNNLLRQEFTGMTRYSGKIDALVFAGDITNCGHKKEYRHLRGMLTFYTSAKNIIPAMGNHDSWNESSDPDFEEATRLFQKFCKFCRIKTDRNYFTATAEGYKFIVLGTESLSHNQAYISDEQLSWFDAQLAAEENSGKPVFVVCHQPIAGKNGVSADITSGSCVGDQNDAIEQIMKAHADNGLNILYMCGHTHETENPVEQDGSITYLKLPSFQYSGGIGYSLRVYEDKMILQGVDFLNGIELENCRFEIEL